ncbi:hypothetical protein CPJCM30710_20320 [Clostridium polyendosporum]|uniref:Lipoprotein n=1 Tax=Clostridium polyendosporum TaxID=69208 RepID=A0A919S142_9CLOT|nr:hypothetical protein [Clostridium polyendosporum]GIM29366.1 hypothetical protein CPJCM30710_20320 [Clostridium polyendosporum]
MKKYLSILIFCIVIFTGCSSRLADKAIEQGKLELSNKEYDKAVASFQLALDEDSNNKEAKELKDIIDGYLKAKKAYDNNNLDESKKLVEGINEKYMNLSIKDDIDKLKADIKDAQQTIAEINQSIEKLNILVNDKKYDEAKALSQELNGKHLSDEQRGKLAEIVKRMNDELAKIEADKKAEEEQKKKEFTVEKAIQYAIKKYGNNPDIAYAYDPQIRYENGKKYFSIIAKSKSMMANGGSGTLFRAKVFEDGTVVEI